MPERLGIGLSQIDPRRGAGWRAGEIQDVARTAEDAGFEATFCTEVKQSPTWVMPVWKSGCGALERAHGGTFRRDVGDDEHVEIALAQRIYRVRLSELG